MENKNILTVTQLNMYVKTLLDSSTVLNSVYVLGEISNFTNHYKTGHLYMSIKDESGLIKAVMFKSSAMKLNFTPENGMKVIVRGKVSLFERDGTYQIYIQAMRQAGVGELQLKYEELKEKLQKEGLFDDAHKKPLPRIPSKIAVITSPTGAAVQDIFNVLTRRFPVARVLMCPVHVQGENAAPELIQAVKRVNKLNCADVIIIGRGGGSIEDLWAFNDEQLARTIYSSNIPVISAVGHETDFTICDYVSDRRAPTPTAAAELAVPDKQELLTQLNKTNQTLMFSLKRIVNQNKLKLETLSNKQCLKNPKFSISVKMQTLDLLDNQMNKAFLKIYSDAKALFIENTSKLNSLSPTNVLLRGYSMIYKEGEVVTSSKQLEAGEHISIKMSDGDVNAEVK